jgi:hypothetical protein
MFVFFLLLFSDNSLFAQVSPSCQTLRKGSFYYYSSSDNNHFAYLREEGTQKEVSLQTGDTAIWLLHWKDDCRYQLHYVSGNKVMDAMPKKSLLTEVKILAVAKDYYTYQSYHPDQPGKLLGSDTLWIGEQTDKGAHKEIVEASFRGGDAAWKRYLEKTLKKHGSELGKRNLSGTCYIRFIVDTDGTVSDITALTMEGTLISAIAMDAIKSGPRWMPGKVNGVPQKMARIQPFVFSED